MDVHPCVYLVAQNQPQLDDAAIADWSACKGLGLTLFYGWGTFVEQVLFWAEIARTDAVAAAVKRIEERLISIEATPAAVSHWTSLTQRTV